MGERKVVNKYYPPDFDPAKIPPPKKQQMKVRMMLPMSIRCRTCGTYTYRGTKFNSRKESVVTETYLGIRIFRLYSKCTKCSAEITLKTDPQNSDYILESGASRNLEPWRAEDEELKKRDAEEILGDAMKSKREMDIVAALDEMKSMKSRRASVSVDAMLEALQRSHEHKKRKPEEEEEEEAALIREVFKGKKEADVLPSYNRLDNVGETSHPSKRIKLPQQIPGKFIFKSSSVKVCIIKKPKEKVTSMGLQTLCHLYGSDEDDE